MILIKASAIKQLPRFYHSNACPYTTPCSRVHSPGVNLEWFTTQKQCKEYINNAFNFSVT